MVEDEMVEDEMSQGEMIEMEELDSDIEFHVGQTLGDSEIKSINNVIKNEKKINKKKIKNNELSKTEKIIEEDNAYKKIGKKKILDNNETNFLNSMFQIKKGLNKVQKSSNDLTKLAKDKNVDILKLIDSSEKIFDNVIEDETGPDPIDDEMDHELEVNVKQSKDDIKQKLKRPDASIHKPKPKHDYKSKDEKEDDIDISLSVSDLIEEEAYEGDDDILDLDLQNTFKNPVNMVPIEDTTFENRLIKIGEKEQECKSKSCKQNLSKKFTIDKKGVEKRMKKLKEAGVLIDPTYEDDITYNQMKLDDNYTMESKKLNELRTSKGLRKPTELRKIYSDAIYKPKEHDKLIDESCSKLQSGLDLNKGTSNYYIFDPSAKKNNKNSDGSLFRYDNKFNYFSNY